MNVSPFNASPGLPAREVQGTPLAFVENPSTLRLIASGLYQLLDDIDTFSDMAKDNHALYRQLVERRQALKEKFLKSDGNNLFVPEGPIPVIPDILKEVLP